MSCTLSKMSSYDVGRVVHDNAAGTYSVQLVRPPSSCPDGILVSKKAEVRIAQGANPSLFFSMQQNRPVIVVPRSEYIEEVGSSGFGFGFFFIVAALLLAIIGITYTIRRRQEGDGTLHAISGEPRPNRPRGGVALAPPTSRNNVATYDYVNRQNTGGTTIINNQPSNGGFVEGMVIGSMMSGGHHDHIIERERIIEREAPSHRSNDSDDSSSNSTFSSDDDSRSSSSSYSSDSDSSSYSSDSSSSYSSDSDSGSFSSDS